MLPTVEQMPLEDVDEDGRGNLLQAGEPQDERTMFLSLERYWDKRDFTAEQFGYHSWRKWLEDLSEAEKYELGALWLSDALHFRTAFPMTTPKARWAHKFLHRSQVRMLRKLVIYVHLALAFVEYPSALLFPLGLTCAFELVACVVYVAELYFRGTIRSWERFRTNNWLMFKAFCVFMVLIDVLVALASSGNSSSRWTGVRPLRMLRVYFLLENSRDLRINFQYFSRVVGQILSVYMFLIVTVVVYAIVGMLLFGSWRACPMSADMPTVTSVGGHNAFAAAFDQSRYIVENTLTSNSTSSFCVRYPHYFTTLGYSFYNLYALLTTVNFPDVMLPAYIRSSWYSLYFISFLIIGLYFLMNVVMSVVLYSYNRFLKLDFNVKLEKQRVALRFIFDLLGRPLSSLHRGPEPRGTTISALPQDFKESTPASDGELVMSQFTFCKLVQTAYPGAHTHDILVLFHDLDRDGSGHLDFEQFNDVCGYVSAHLDSSQQRLSRASLSISRLPSVLSESGGPTRNDIRESLLQPPSPHSQAMTRRRGLSVDDSGDEWDDPTGAGTDTDSELGGDVGRPRKSTITAHYRRVRGVPASLQSPQFAGRRGQDELGADSRPGRFRWRGVRRLCRRIARHRLFVWVVHLAIAGNLVDVLVEAATYEGGEYSHEQPIGDIIFCGLVLLEMLILLLADGVRVYWSKGWNRYDIFILVLGVAIQAATYPRAEGILLFRVLVSFRVARRTKRFRNLLSLGGKLLGPFAVNFGVLFVLFYVYAIIGIWAFSGKLPTTAAGVVKNVHLTDTFYGTTPNYQEIRFDSFSRTMVILFSMMVVNNWHVIASGVMAVTSAWSVLYFVTFHFLVVVISLNILLAFFLEIFTAFYHQQQPGQVRMASSIVEYKLLNKAKGQRTARRVSRNVHVHRTSRPHAVDSPAPLRVVL